MESGGGAAAAGGKRKNDKPYKGIRMRKWGKWVAEIREPHKRSRIWLGSYSSPVAAARAYDAAVYYLRGPSARLNFPEEIPAYCGLKDMSSAAIRQKAIEIGARVDALQNSQTDHHHHHHLHQENHEHPKNFSLKPSWFQEKVDLNQMPPQPEDSSDVDYW